MLAACDDSLNACATVPCSAFGFADGERLRSEIAAADARDLGRVGDQGYI